MKIKNTFTESTSSPYENSIFNINSSLNRLISKNIELYLLKWTELFNTKELSFKGGTCCVEVPSSDIKLYVSVSEDGTFQKIKAQRGDEIAYFTV